MKIDFTHNKMKEDIKAECLRFKSLLKLFLKECFPFDGILRWNAEYQVNLMLTNISRSSLANLQLNA